jgi:hypothetical protein
MTEFTDEQKDLTRLLREKLSNSLQEWVSSTFTKEVEGFKIELPEMDAIINGIINFTGLELANITKIFISNDEKFGSSEFTERAANEFATQLKTAYLRNLGE